MEAVITFLFEEFRPAVWSPRKS